MRKTIQRKDVTTAPALASPSNNSSTYLINFYNKTKIVKAAILQVPVAINKHSLLGYQMDQGPRQLPYGPDPARN